MVRVVSRQAVEQTSKIQKDWNEVDVCMSVCLHVGGYGAEAREASARANETQLRAVAAETTVQGIVDQLPDDERRVSQIPRDVDAARKDIRDARSQVTFNNGPSLILVTSQTHFFDLNHNVREDLCCYRFWWIRNAHIIVIITPHGSTAYVDASYCYRRSSMVCLSVCLSRS